LILSVKFIVLIKQICDTKERVTEVQGDTSKGPINFLMYIDMKIINMLKTNYVNKSATYSSDFG